MTLSKLKIKDFLAATFDGNYHSFLLKNFRNLNERRFFEISLIRSFENKLLDCFSKGLISGTTHTYIGQECNSVAIFENVDLKKDIIWSNHRCHGHFISYSGKIFELMAEIFGKSSGICQGRGGSQHLHYKNFYSNGILGGSVPQAVGASYAIKNTGGITIAFIGDGTMGEGVLYECLNIASLWNCPILFVCENNSIAQTTAVDQNLSGTIQNRVKGFNIEFKKCEKYNFEDIINKSKKIIGYVRKKNKPAFLEIKSVRLGPHSKGDDTRKKKIINDIFKKDIFIKLKKKIKTSKEIEVLTSEIIEKTYLRVVDSK
tara:strand:- start:1152 stop:2099 length:948 start_codon:yes stop_codon:yes gene_type:complete